MRSRIWRSRLAMVLALVVALVSMIVYLPLGAVSNGGHGPGESFGGRNVRFLHKRWRLWRCMMGGPYVAMLSVLACAV